MAGNPTLSAELALKARALLGQGGATEELGERDRELPAAFRAEIESAAAAAAPATEAVGHRRGQAAHRCRLHRPARSLR